MPELSAASPISAVLAADSVPRGLLRRLRLARFRSLAPTDWRPAAGWNLIHGPNGSGKSSVLEALYLAATGKSFRTREPDGVLRPPLLRFFRRVLQ